MGGRGRGRGRGGFIKIEALGLNKGEKENPSLPPLAQPPPLYPPLQFKPVPWQQSSDLDYLLALKQELRESFHKSPFYIKAPNKVKDIERYSDKYQPGSNDDVSSCFSDWTRVPYELREHPRKRVKVDKTKHANKFSKLDDGDDVSKLLEKLEQNDAKLDTTENAEANEEGDDEEKKEGENEEGEEEEYDEEDAEEETDYNQAYFDNGEEYDDDDEDDEGPTY